MGGASFSFLEFGAAVVIFFNLSRHLAWRQTVLFLASIGFPLFFTRTPLAFVPLACFLLFGFIALRLMQAGARRSSYLVMLISVILIFIWLKKYSVLPSVLYLRFFYVTLGLSYIFFRVLHLIIDAHQNGLPKRVGFVSYINYTLNFTTFISGPIQRYQEFSAFQLVPKPLTLNVIQAGRAIERIVVGFFKVNVISLILSSIHLTAISTITSPLPWSSRVCQAILLIAVYPVYLYFNFSGYIDIVIGMARLLRIELPENFNRPFESDNAINFWGRWHMTLSMWLKTYVYNNLLIWLMRRYTKQNLEPFLGVFAFFVTFFLVGVWHGSTANFLVFGLLAGGGVSGVKLYQIFMTASLGKKPYRALASTPIYNALARGLNFTWFAITLLWFWSNSAQLSYLLHQVSGSAILAAIFLIFLIASILLEAWERIRAFALSWTWDQEPIVLSRYTRTAWSTALLVVSVGAVLLLNMPAPQIVYKGF